MNVNHLQENILGQASNAHLTHTVNNFGQKLSDDSELGWQACHNSTTTDRVIIMCLTL